MQIELDSIYKEYKILNQREGLVGSIQDLFSRNYRKIDAVKNISFNISEGEIVGCLGPNGAGKSTIIKMMTGVLPPTSGSIKVCDVVPYQHRTRVAQNIGVVLGQRSQLWWSLPVIESFKILKSIYQISDLQYKQTMEFYHSMLDIEVILSRQVRQLSLGQRTLCDILAAFLHNPEIVFLDEPTIGLDIVMKSKIRELIKMINKEKNTTILLTTHDIGDVDALCERILIIDKGQLLYDNDINHLKKMFGAYRTLKIRIGKTTSDMNQEYLEIKTQEIKEVLKTSLRIDMSNNIVVEDGWISILIDEENIDVISVLDMLKSIFTIVDIKVEEISTESVIKKMYEGKE